MRNSGRFPSHLSLFPDESCKIRLFSTNRFSLSGRVCAKIGIDEKTKKQQHQSDLGVKILSNMAADQRAAIISNMSVANASQVTILMEK